MCRVHKLYYWLACRISSKMTLSIARRQRWISPIIYLRCPIALNFELSTTVSLSCSVQTFKTVGLRKRKFLTSEISHYNNIELQYLILHLQMKYFEASLLVFNIFLPAYLCNVHPSVNATAQGIVGASLPYASDEKYPKEGSSTASTDLGKNGLSSIYEYTKLNTSTVIPSGRFRHISSRTQDSQENGLPARVSQPCSLASKIGAIVSVEEYVAVQYEANEYEVSAEFATSKSSEDYLKHQTASANDQKTFTEFPVRVSKNISANGNISQVPNATQNVNISHIGYDDYYDSIFSPDTDPASDYASTHDSINNIAKKSSTNALETLRNYYCDGDSLVDGISLKSCPSCQGQCGEVGTVKKSRVQCSCDRACLVYRDCCPDFEMHCMEQYTQGLTISNSMSGSWDSSCVMLRTSDGYRDRYLLISECNGTVYDLVENRGVPTISGGIPVEDMMTGIFFINYDCAKCHGATNLRPMQVKLLYDLQQCGVNQEDAIQLRPNVNARPDYNDTQSRQTSDDTKSTDAGRLQTTSGLAGGGETLHVEVQETIIPFLAPPGIIPYRRYKFVGEPPRSCYNKLIDRCSESCSNNRLIELCLKSGYMYTTFNDINYKYLTFKNVYCAICHLESDDFTCGRINHKDSDAVYDPDLSIFSLSVLFDFNSSPRVSSVGVVCKEDQVILPNSMVCGDIVCPDGYSLQHDTCAPLNTTQHFTREFLFLVAVNTSSGCTMCKNNTMIDFNNTFSHINKQFVAIFRNVSENVSTKSVEISCSCINLPLMNISIKILPHLDVNYLVSTVSKKLEVEGTAMVLNSLLTYLYAVNDTVSFSRITFLAFNSSPVSSEYDLPCLGHLIPDKSFVVIGTELILKVSGHAYQEDEYILKNGSAFVCYKSIKPNTDDPISRALAILSIVLSTLSFSCICIRITMQFTTQKYKNVANRMQFQLSLALCLSTGLLLTSPLAASNAKVCSILASMKYFSYLASFAWMTCIAGDTWWVLKKTESCIKDNPDRSIVKYSLICWLLPLQISVLVFGLDYSPMPSEYKPQLGGLACWIANMSSTLIYFFAPVSACVTMNIIFFWFAIASLRKTFEGSNMVRKTTDKNKEIRVYLKLLILMGLTWAIGIIAPWINTPAVWFLLTMFNASQGMSIFFAFVFDVRILRSVTRKCCPHVIHGATTEIREQNVSNNVVTIIS